MIVGAHQDSVGSTSAGRSPGADDNGSGTVTILEAFRILAESKFKPKNTLEFHWYAGEEGGLLGSAGIFANYKSSAKTVLAFLNQDMTGYSPAGKPVVYTDYTNAALTTYLRLIVTQYTGIVPLTSTCGYGCSDHASGTSNGFRRLISIFLKMSKTDYGLQHLLLFTRKFLPPLTQRFTVLVM